MAGGKQHHPARQEKAIKTRRGIAKRPCPGVGWLHQSHYPSNNLVGLRTVKPTGQLVDTQVTRGREKKTTWEKFHLAGPHKFWPRLWGLTVDKGGGHGGGITSDWHQKIGCRSSIYEYQIAPVEGNEVSSVWSEGSRVHRGGE